MNKFQLVNILHKQYKKAFLYAKETKLSNIDLIDFPFTELLFSNISSYDNFLSKNLTCVNPEQYSNTIINLSYYCGEDTDDMIILHLEYDDEDNKDQSSIIQILYNIPTGIHISFLQRKTPDTSFSRELYYVDKDLNVNHIFEEEDILLMSLENDHPIVVGYDFIIEDFYERT